MLIALLQASRICEAVHRSLESGQPELVSPYLKQGGARRPTALRQCFHENLYQS